MYNQNTKVMDYSYNWASFSSALPRRRLPVRLAHSPQRAPPKTLQNLNKIQKLWQYQNTKLTSYYTGQYLSRNQLLL